MTTRKKITQTILGLLICYVTVIYIPQGIKLFFKAEGEVSKFLIYAFCQIGLCLSLLFYVLKVEKRSLASIGFKPFIGERDVKWGLIGFGLAGISFAITGPLLESFGFESTRDEVIKLAKYSIWMRIGIAVIAGFPEEILFRTYPLERLSELFGNIWIAGLISLILFAGLHLPFWSLGGAIQIGIGTLIWTLIYIKTRSIWTMIIMHTVNDLFAFVVLPYFFVG